jgi:hypothetical protein
MDPTGRGGMIRLVEAEARIAGLAGERAVLVLQRGKLDIKLSIPVPPNQQNATRTGRALSSHSRSWRSSP